MNKERHQKDNVNNYWQQFLKTGKLEDYLKYKYYNEKNTEDMKVEIAKIDEINGDINEQKKSFRGGIKSK